MSETSMISGSCGKEFTIVYARSFAGRPQMFEVKVQAKDIEEAKGIGSLHCYEKEQEERLYHWAFHVVTEGED